MTVPVARWSDPATSWEAAQSVVDIRESQWRIWNLLRIEGGMTDEGIRRAYEYRFSMISPSGCRTRRVELQRKGLVRHSNRYALTSAGRKTIIWEAVSLEDWKRADSQLVMAFR